MVEMQSQLQTVLLQSQIYLLQDSPVILMHKDLRKIHVGTLQHFELSATSFSFPFPRIYNNFRGISHVVEGA